LPPHPTVPILTLVFSVPKDPTGSKILQDRAGRTTHYQYTLEQADVGRILADAWRGVAAPENFHDHPWKVRAGRVGQGVSAAKPEIELNHSHRTLFGADEIDVHRPHQFD
jgi:hypothetical protein